MSSNDDFTCVSFSLEYAKVATYTIVFVTAATQEKSRHFTWCPCVSHIETWFLIIKIILLTGNNISIEEKGTIHRYLACIHKYTTFNNVLRHFILCPHKNRGIFSFIKNVLLLSWLYAINYELFSSHHHSSQVFFSFCFWHSMCQKRSRIVDKTTAFKMRRQ